MPNLYFGGDYTPEHFPREVMLEDIRFNHGSRKTAELEKNASRWFADPCDEI